VNFTTITQENILFLIAGIFAISLLTQLFYYLFVYARLIYSRKRPVSPAEQVPVSVVICARNEEENLGKFLPLILEQDYPLYEVIVVNDCSKDNTENLLGELKQKYKHLKSTIIKEDDKFSHGKKLALTIGIKAASYEYLILTDADCEPASKNWLNEIQKNFSDEKNLILGYGGYFAEKGILNNIIRYETLFTAMQYLGFALTGKPYMGVGRNLAYKRELFFKNKGFANHLHLMSGDDDLFVQQVAGSKNTAVEFSHEAHTRSIPKRTFKNWFLQKRRHLTTGLHYRGMIKFRLSLEILTRYTLIASFIFLLLEKFHSEYLISLFALRYLAFLIVIKFVMRRLNEKKLFLPSLIYDILLPVSNFAAIITNFALSKKNKWK
jgi:poly-beta-1,6-N-acetyl-D-glucosamine synthase